MARYETTYYENNRQGARQAPAVDAPAAAPAVSAEPAAPGAPGQFSPGRPVFSAIRWGAILAGVAVGLSIQLLLTLLGVASGLATATVAGSEVGSSGPLIWAALSMLISAFVGGYVAARMSGLKRRADGVLHGAVSWAVTTLLFAVLATSIGGALVGTVFSSMTQVAQAQAQAAEGEGPLADFIDEQFGQLGDAVLERLQVYLQQGDRAQAVQLLTSAAGMDPQRAEEVVDQALILTGSPEAASAQSRREAESALEGASTAAWIVFGAVALGLLLGIGGGSVGVAGARRVNWSAERA